MDYITTVLNILGAIDGAIYHFFNFFLHTASVVLITYYIEKHAAVAVLIRICNKFSWYIEQLVACYVIRERCYTIYYLCCKINSKNRRQ